MKGKRILSSFKNPKKRIDENNERVIIKSEMALVTCYAIILLFLFPSFSMDVNDPRKYILLIKDVHKYYETTCIIIVRSDSHTGKFCSLFSKIVRVKAK